jgi:PAS domain-containing protein
MEFVEMSEPAQLGFWSGLVATVIAAFGGGKGIIALMRRMLASRARVKAIREDNEQFKSEVRSGLRVLRHITQRIDANQRATVALDGRPIMQACDEGAVQWINPAFTRQLGWTIDEVNGSAWITNAIADRDQARIREQWEAAVRFGDFLSTHAKVVHRHTRVLLEAEIEAQPKKCTDGTKFGWDVVVRLKEVAA